MPSSLETAVREIGFALAPLDQVFRSPAGPKQLLEQIGWELPPGLEDIGLAGANVGDLIDKLTIIVNSTEAEQADTVLMIGRYADLLVAVTNLVRGIEAIASALPGSGLLDGTYLATSHLADELPVRLIDFLLVVYVQQRSYPVFALLVLLG